MKVNEAIPEVGDTLEPLTRVITTKKINQFEALSSRFKSDGSTASPPANIHTDQNRAREMGLERPIASGQLSFAYLHELLARHFGIDFRQGGRLSVTFLKPVYAGDTLTARGVVQSREPVDGRTRLTLAVWLENQGGEQMARGTAEVTVPSPLT